MKTCTYSIYRSNSRKQPLKHLLLSGDNHVSCKAFLKYEPDGYYGSFGRRLFIMERIPITREGLDRLKKELEHIKRVERPRNVRAIEEARAHGDLSENAEYHAAKERQSFIEGRLTELESVIGRAEVIEVNSSATDRVVFGKTVLIYNITTDEEIKYQLLGPYESEPENGRISVHSPLGQALIGREVGDEIKVKTPGGIQEFEILEII
jgi:transcription elongation factor GreA